MIIVMTTDFERDNSPQSDDVPMVAIFRGWDNVDNDNDNDNDNFILEETFLYSLSWMTGER